MRLAVVNLTATVQAGGVETVSREISRIMADRGHRVILYGGHGGIPLDHAGVTVRTFPFIPRNRFPDLGTRFRKFMERLSFARHALPAVTADGADWILVFKPFDMPLARRAAKRLAARAAFWSGGTEFFWGYGWLAGRMDRLLSCSRHNAGQITAAVGRTPEVLYNGIDAGRFVPRPRDTGLRQTLGLAEQGPLLMSVCRLVPLKGLHVAVRSVGLLAERGLPVSFVIVGDGPARPDLEALARELGVADRVRFVGRMDNEAVPGYYALADLALCPSVGEEAFGIAAAEAMACGVPVIASRVGGLPEVLGEDGGLLIPPKDPAALADAVEHLLADPARRSGLSQSAVERSRRLFSWDAVARRLEDLLA